MSQIKDKEAADVLSKHISDEFQRLQEQLKNLAHERLLKGADKTPGQWQMQQNANIKAFEKQVEQQCTNAGKTAQKGFNKDIRRINVPKESLNDDTVRNLYDILGKNVIKEYKSSVDSVGRELKSQVAPSLYQTIAKKINESPKQPYVVYKDGKHIRLENYMEMRLRTDINHEVAKNFLDINQELGQVFYICSEHGNCADDHIDYQGKVYCSQNWEEACPEEYKEQVAAYIEENHIMSIEDAMGEEGNYLTTRPNCRHYFQMISISSVLDIKTEQDRENYLKEAGMSYNTSYKEESYQALGVQRYNERQIREWRERYDTMKLVIDNRPKVDLRSADEETKKFYQKQNAELKYYSMKLRSWQSRQRQHMQTNPGLDRWYGRERYNRLFKRVSSNNMNASTMVKEENNKQYYKEYGLGAGESEEYKEFKHDPPVYLGKIDITDKKMVESTILKFEENAVKEKLETALVITKDGEMYKCFGDDENVDILEIGIEKLYNAIVTHNHVEGKTHYSFGGEDREVFKNNGLAILRGIDSDYIYEFNRDYNEEYLESESNILNPFKYEKNNEEHSLNVLEALKFKFGYWRKKR